MKSQSLRKKQKEIAKIKTKYNRKQVKIQIAQAIAQTAVAALNAYASAAAIPVVGHVLAPIAAGIATAAGMIQVATIKKQAQAQEAGYYEGGFTGGSRYRREAGVVHEGEFVANHNAVNNPQLLPALRLIDVAQRIVITRPEINGRLISSLHFRERYGVTVTRVKRTGLQFVATPNLRLRLGDRINVVGTEKGIANVSKEVGNVVKNLDDPNLVAIFVGIFLGLILGSLPIEVGLDYPLRLGLAGGSVIMGILSISDPTWSTAITSTPSGP